MDLRVPSKRPVSPSPSLSAASENTLTTAQGSMDAIESQNTTSSQASTAVAAPSPREQKLISLKSQLESLEQQLAEVRKKQAIVDQKLRHPDDPEATVKKHIRLLHEFNEIRDVAQGLIGLIAESRGVRVQEIYPEFGLDVDD